MGAIAAAVRRSWWGGPAMLAGGLFLWEAGAGQALGWRLSLVYVAALCAQVLVVALERAPVWPTSTAIRRRFSLNNLALLLPFLGYMIEGTQLWQSVQQL